MGRVHKRPGVSTNTSVASASSAAVPVAACAAPHLFSQQEKLIGTAVEQAPYCEGTGDRQRRASAVHDLGRPHRAGPCYSQAQKGRASGKFLATEKPRFRGAISDTTTTTIRRP
jgi:hypothetical protein